MTEPPEDEDKKTKAERKAGKNQKREERKRKYDEKKKRKLKEEEKKRKPAKEKREYEEEKSEPEKGKKAVHKEEKIVDLEDVFYTPVTKKFADSAPIKQEREHKQNGASFSGKEPRANQKQCRTRQQAGRAASSHVEREMVQETPIKQEKSSRKEKASRKEKGYKKDRTPNREKTPKKVDFGLPSPIRKHARSFHRALHDELEKANNKTASEEMEETMDTEARD